MHERGDAYDHELFRATLFILDAGLRRFSRQSNPSTNDSGPRPEGGWSKVGHMVESHLKLYPYISDI